VTTTTADIHNQAAAAPVEAEAMQAPAEEGDAVVVPAELLPQKRKPGRPPGSKNKDRVATIERLTKEADPLGYRIRALKRGWVMAAPSEGATRRERILLTKDEMLRLSQQLEDKVLPRLRSFEVTGDGMANNVLIGTLNSLEETQLKHLIAALHPQYPVVVSGAEIAQAPDDGTSAVVIQPPRWSTK